jgi:hypothetical protein
MRALATLGLVLLGGAAALVAGYVGFQAYLKWMLRGQSPPVSYE